LRLSISATSRSIVAHAQHSKKILLLLPYGSALPLSASAPAQRAIAVAISSCGTFAPSLPVFSRVS